MQGDSTSNKLVKSIRLHTCSPIDRIKRKICVINLKRKFAYPKPIKLFFLEKPCKIHLFNKGEPGPLNCPDQLRLPRSYGCMPRPAILNEK